MATITMQGIAVLAQVKRPVVSMWRSRFATSEPPFPAPTGERPLRFDAREVAQWLRETEHGNNVDAHLESALHSTAMEQVLDDVDAASALLLLHQVRGEPLAEVDPIEVVHDLEAHELGSILDPGTALSALGDNQLCQAVDELAEAAFSGEHVLGRLLDSFTAADGPWAGEALTRAAEALLGTALVDIHRAAPRGIVPAGPGGVLLATALGARLEESEQATFGYRPSGVERPCDLAALRRLAARDFPVTIHDEAASSPDDGMLHLFQWQDVANPDAFFDRIEDVLVELGDRDVLIVVGPARLMTDRYGERGRRHLLAPSADYTAPLRYVARLPKGMSRHGGRRRLALWVFGQPSSRWTVVGAHSDARVGPNEARAIAADIAASITRTDVRDHAFTSSTRLASDRLLRQMTLTAPAANPAPWDGGDQLARIWELDPGLMEGLEFAATPAKPDLIPWTRATRELARDLPGVRLPAEHLDALQAGRAVVIGPDEIRDPARPQTRGIDRLTLEVVAPRARYTEPGDVIYVASGGAASMVDTDGGKVVQAPARILRCRDAELNDRELVPAVVAEDIAAQPGTDRQTWLLRTVPAHQTRALAVALQRTAKRRQQLRDELAAVDELEAEIINGLTAGSLTATLHTTTSTKDKS
ncbi:MAG: hypothetical protein ACTH2Q_00495 [Propionibacteriaceae bacterium]